MPTETEYFAIEKMKRRKESESAKFKQQKLSVLFKRVDKNVVSDETTSDSCEPNTDETG